MKTIHTFINIFALALVTTICLTGCAGSNSAQTANQGDSTIAKSINQQRFTFIAQNVMPTEDSRYNIRNLFPNAANMYQLTSRYDLKVTPDSITAYLPFFGRSYTAPVNPNEGGIKFTSTKFSYNQSFRKKNTIITIKTQDIQDPKTLYLSISPSGYASLNVQSVNKTPISFYGRIETSK